jgi:hypothetical protein
MKINLLALASTAAAVPHYGAYSHGQFHSKSSGTAVYGAGKPYPTGAWTGGYNSTAAPYVAGSSSYHDGKTTTIGETSTSTKTVYSTVVVKNSASGNYEASSVAAENVSTGAGQCGPATITVTASEKVTVTVTPGADVPKSSAAQVESYGASSPAAEKPASSAVEYPAETPKVEASTTPAAEYPAQTPSVEATSSKAEYVALSYAQKQPEAYSSAVAPSSAAAYSTAVASPSASASAAPSSGNTYSGTKRGLAYNEANLCSTLGSKFGFGYNWGQVENNDIGTDFIPMMHGPSKSTAEEWLANVDTAVKKGSKAVMGFNECDHAEQCNLSPEAACAAWKTYMNPIKSSHPDVTIIGPSVTNGNAPPFTKIYKANRRTRWCSYGSRLAQPLPRQLLRRRC